MRLSAPLIALFLLVAACSSAPKRNPVPADLVGKARIPGMVQVREFIDGVEQYWDEFDSQSAEWLRSEHPALADTEHNYLAISGGGANGAYGAGLLCGWTESGNRPEFAIVTGISTGALIAPFAFLGPEYDATLKTVYTSLSTADLIKKRGFLAFLTSDAIADTDGLKAKIKEYVTDAVIDAVAKQSRRGRILVIATTNLDARRPVLWDMGLIAMSSAPHRYDVFRDVLLASASIPAAFPPVMFEVEANGESYDELHVDGGATAQVFLYPTSLDWRSILDKLGAKGQPTAWVMRNSRLRPDYEPVDRKLFPIAVVTIDALLRTQGIGDLYRIHGTCQRDGVAFRMTAIPDDFDRKPEEPFDKEYMIELFAVGYELGKSGAAWSDQPPHSVPE